METSRKRRLFWIITFSVSIGFFATLAATALLLVSGFQQDTLSAKREIESLRGSLHSVSSILDNSDFSERRFCLVPDELHSCVASAKDGRVTVIPEGDYFLKQGLQVPSGARLVVETGARITLAETAEMPVKGGYVLGLVGSPSDPVKDVVIILNGTVDGNKSAHPYESSGNEGIKVDFGDQVVIFGSGTVENASGDGVDFDSTTNSLVSGITIKNNDGAGMHFGTPRPISSSENNQIIGVTTTGNGFKHSRSGADVSWPNRNSATYAWVEAQSNYQNWDLSGFGSAVFRSFSGTAQSPDNTRGAQLAELNGQSSSSLWPNLDYVFQLLKRDLRVFLGFEDVPDFLKELRYWR